jgi:predicted nucleic acid-binding protein
MTNKIVFVDTSYLIHLTAHIDTDLHRNAKEYQQYFTNNGIVIKVSTIVLTEYCTQGSHEDLPMKEIQIAAFNANHAIKSGQIAQSLYRLLKDNKTISIERQVVRPDAMIFAQAYHDNASYFITADKKSQKKF